MTFKAGSTFKATYLYNRIEDYPLDLTGATVTSEIRSPVGVLLATMVVTLDADNLTATGIVADTSTWAAGTYQYDFKVVWPDLRITYSPTITLKVEPHITD